MAGSRAGKLQHNKYSRASTPSDVTITRRHHPLQGHRLEVVSGGTSAIVVRILDGTTMRIPRAWTDADGAPPHETPETVFSIEALRDLLRLVDAISARTCHLPCAIGPNVVLSSREDINGKTGKTNIS